MARQALSSAVNRAIAEGAPVYVNVPVFDHAAFVRGLCSKAMGEWSAWMRTFCGCQPAHMYFRRGGPNAAGDVLIIDGEQDAPEGYELAMPLSLAWDRSRVEREVWKALQTMPILPY